MEQYIDCSWNRCCQRACVTPSNAIILRRNLRVLRRETGKLAAPFLTPDFSMKSTRLPSSVRPSATTTRTTAISALPASGCARGRRSIARIGRSSMRTGCCATAPASSTAVPAPSSHADARPSQRARSCVHSTGGAPYRHDRRLPRLAPPEKEGRDAVRTPQAHRRASGGIRARFATASPPAHQPELTSFAGFGRIHWVAIHP